jgi:hypothetical protein
MQSHYRDIIAIVLGFPLALFPGWFSRQARSRRQSRLNELEQGAPEVYFEERRTLDTYKPLKSVWAVRLLGVAMIALGLFRYLGKPFG